MKRTTTSVLALLALLACVSIPETETGATETPALPAVPSTLEAVIPVNQEYLDDERLTRERQFEVLTEIFNMKVRNEEIRAISNHFSPVFRNGHPLHLSVLGKTGTGKTITLLWFLAQIQHLCEERGIPFRQVHLDLCCPAPCFRALNTLACMLGASKIYKKGISLEELMSSIELNLKSSKGYLVIFVDEADNVRTDFNTFYQFLIKRLPQRNASRLILIFVSNRLNWPDNLDPPRGNRHELFDRTPPPYFDPSDHPMFRGEPRGSRDAC